jgi:hypothetical protein
MGVVGRKITINLKNCTKIGKTETHAHWKRARSRERMIELQQ